MRFLPIHEQRDPKEVKDLLRSQKTCLLMTQTDDGLPRVGIYNFLADEGKFFIHIGRRDEQARDLEKRNLCLVVFQDILSVIPSFWIDRDYGGAINNFFRYAEFKCEARILEKPQEMLPIMQRMLDWYQPERSYQTLDPSSDVYRDKFAMISVVELTVHASRTKWNLGQQKPVNAFENVITQLEIRRDGPDERTADEMKRWRERALVLRDLLFIPSQSRAR